jgi:transcriptional regulator with XRE-family HTH domain
MDFGKQLKNIIKAKGIKSSTLAQRMNISNAYVSQLVTGVRKPGRETLLKLSKALEIPIETLFILGAVRFEETMILRKIPVLNVMTLDLWRNTEDLNYPLLHADTFEHATTNDPYAFYLKAGIHFLPGSDPADLVLIEPNAEIHNGNTVLVLTGKRWIFMKIAVKDTIRILFDGQQQPILYSDESNTDGFRLFRATQCIKRL